MQLLLEAGLDRVRANGVAVDNERFLACLVCDAMPVNDKTGRYLASLAVQAPVAPFGCAPGIMPGRRGARPRPSLQPSNPRNPGENTRPKPLEVAAFERQPRTLIYQ
jgi:hypothetical protein